MRDLLKFYIDGAWVDPIGTQRFDAVNPATEEISGRIALGNEADVDRAVKAARRAFFSFSHSSREERLEYLKGILKGMQDRTAQLCEAITLEMGAPNWVSEQAQSQLPIIHTQIAIDNLKTFEFEKPRGNSLIRLEPAGVCALIAPWNWPVFTVMTKVLPTLAVGCTIVLKPSEYSPYSAQILAEIIHNAGVPAGVFNMVYGDGPVVGVALSVHPEVDVVSITGSTRAGAEVARNAATTIKRVHQELGGKSPNVILPSADIPGAVERGVRGLMFNAGQSCSAPSRMLAPNARMDEVKAAARAAAAAIRVGPPDSNAFIGPVANRNQFEQIQDFIKKGIEEGATLLTGGLGRPEGLDKGYYVKPTIFADTSPEMTIVRQEIFGPVLVIQGYEDLDDAIEKANDTEYGLAAYIQGDIEEARQVATRIPAGQVFLNGSGLDLIDFTVPFGGFKRSGNGREWGDYAFEAFLEAKALVGYIPVERAGTSQ